MYTNAQSLIAHKEELQHLIMWRRRPAMVALSETRVTEEIEDKEVNVCGYNMFRCNAESRNTGGVILYIRDDINYGSIWVRKLVANYWSVAVELKDRISKDIIVVVYHSPSASHGEFIKFLENLIDELNKKGNCMIIGDFNIDINMDSFYKNKLLTTMDSLGLKQYVNKPTRITCDSRTIIDLVFSNKKVDVRVNDEPKITDHAWLIIGYNIGKQGNKRKYNELYTRDYSRINVNVFWELIEGETMQKYKRELKVNIWAEKFIKTIIDVLNKVAPVRKCRVPRKWQGKKWFTEEIRETTRRRDVAYRQAIVTNEEKDWERFKMERNATVKLTKKKKKEYYESNIDYNKNDPKSMWRALKEL